MRTHIEWVKEHQFAMLTVIISNRIKIESLQSQQKKSVEENYVMKIFPYVFVCV